MEIWNIRRISSAWIAKNCFVGNELIFNDGDIVSYLDDENHVVVFEIEEKTPKWRMGRSLWGMKSTGTNEGVLAEIYKHVGKCSPVVVSDHTDDHIYND